MTLHLDLLRASIVSDVEELTADGSIPKSEVADLLRSLASELENRAPEPDATPRFTVDMNGRLWSVEYVCGDLFGHDDFVGFVLQIEVKSRGEAKDLLAQLFGAGLGPNPPTDIDE